MKNAFLLLLIIFFFNVFADAQIHNDSLPDISRQYFRYLNPNPEYSKEDSIDCMVANIFFLSDSNVKEIVYLRKNFSDQFLQVCNQQRMYPASRIWGFNMDQKYFRSATTANNYHVFAERMVQGKISLYSLPNTPSQYGDIQLISGDPKNPDYINRSLVEDRSRKRNSEPYHYFISPSSDSSRMILVTSKNLKTIAKDNFSNCPPAYQDAMRFHKKYRTVQNIALTVGVASYLVSFLNIGGNGVNALNYQSPFLYVSAASLGTFIYYRIKANRKILQADDLRRMIQTVNQY